MKQFPDMITWIDEIGMDRLHEMHRENDSISFSEFVKEYYVKCQESAQQKISFEMDTDKDIMCETVKQIFVDIFECGLQNTNVNKIIRDNDLAPDLDAEREIQKSFRKDLIPAVEKFLKKLDF